MLTGRPQRQNKKQNSPLTSHGQSTPVKKGKKKKKKKLHPVSIPAESPQKEAKIEPLKQEKAEDLAKLYQFVENGALDQALTRLGEIEEGLNETEKSIQEAKWASERARKAADLALLTLEMIKNKEQEKVWDKMSIEELQAEELRVTKLFSTTPTSLLWLSAKSLAATASTEDIISVPENFRHIILIARRFIRLGPVVLNTSRGQVSRQTSTIVTERKIEEKHDDSLPVPTPLLTPNLINSSTLIKYYSFNQTELTVEGTWYCGRKDTFTKPDQKSTNEELYYPDEYLIASMLKKYTEATPHHQDKTRTVRILTQPWVDHERKNIRNGKFNDCKTFNELIIKTIKENSDQNILIVVPFLYGNHHPGIAIDIKNKKVIYIDPFGAPHHYLHYLFNLPQRLKDEGFSFEIVNAQQQIREQDTSSCGPILTASFIKCIDEYFTTGSISSAGFERSRKQLATERMVQMRINNMSSLSDGSDVNEIMLADVSLWKSFLSEQKIDDPIKKQLMQIIERHKKYIRGLKHNWSTVLLCVKDIAWIRDFQSNMVDFILKKNYENIQQLLLDDQNIFKHPTETDSKQATSIQLPAALSTEMTPLSRAKKSIEKIIDNYIASLSCCNFYGRKRALELKEAVIKCDRIDAFQAVMVQFIQTGKTLSDDKWYNFFRSPTQSSSIGRYSLQGMIIDHFFPQQKKMADWLRIASLRSTIQDERAVKRRVTRG